MFNVQVQRNMNVPRDRVWNVLKDFGGHYRFNPYVEYSPIINGITQGLGSERELRFYDGPAVKQKIIDYEEGRMILVGITESSWPIKRGWTRVTLEDAGEDACQLDYHLNYRTAIRSACAADRPVLQTRFYEPVQRRVEKRRRVCGDGQTHSPRSPRSAGWSSTSLSFTALVALPTSHVPIHVSIHVVVLSIFKSEDIRRYLNKEGESAWQFRHQKPMSYWLSSMAG